MQMSGFSQLEMSGSGAGCRLGKLGASAGSLRRRLGREVGVQLGEVLLRGGVLGIEAQRGFEVLPRAGEVALAGVDGAHVVPPPPRGFAGGSNP